MKNSKAEFIKLLVCIDLREPSIEEFLLQLVNTDYIPSHESEVDNIIMLTDPSLNRSEVSIKYWQAGCYDLELSYGPEKCKAITALVRHIESTTITVSDDD